MTWWRRFSKLPPAGHEAPGAAPREEVSVRPSESEALPAHRREGEVRAPLSKGKNKPLSGPRAITADGHVGWAVTGDNNHTVVNNFVAGDGPKRLSSVYEREIRYLAAANFQGRESELAAMGSFAGGEDPTGTGYWRWLAPAWSGKTALMAQFALRAPDQVDVLAFFITARLAGRSDRTAFLTTVQDQLRAYLQDSDVDCTDYGGFCDALSRATEQARSCGRRLVLVIDGMDEDSGVASAASGYSIAGLLPPTLPDGLHVIVAGRPNPPVPSDVAPDHPLRRVGINHPLAESAAARAVREDAERSLEALIAAEGISLDLVGLTAAAGGGLSADDLSALTGEHTARRIEIVLGGAAGRSFQLRPAQWARRDGCPVPLYSFAHQELLVGARHLLLVSLLDGYRDRVHEFARFHREKGWAADTPEYLLMGYPQMLRERRDARRLVELGTDPARHERLWRTTETDTRALTEIADAFALQHASAEPDLKSCVELSYYRDELQQKVINTPVEAIWAWARSGHVRKAVALAAVRAEFSPTTGESFGVVFQEARSVGDAGMVMEAIGAVTDVVVRDSALRQCVQVLVTEKRPQEAMGVAGTLTDLRQRTQALTAVAQALVEVGEKDQGTALALTAAEAGCTLDEPDHQVAALKEVVSVLVNAGAQDRAEEVAAAAARTAHGISGPDDPAFPLAYAAAACAEAGRKDEAVELARAAVGAARTIDEFSTQELALEVARTWLALQETGQAIHVTHLVTDQRSRVATLALLAEELTRKGETEEAAHLAAVAREASRAITNAEEQVEAKARAAEALAKTGRAAEAAELALEAADTADGINDPDVRTSALEDLSQALSTADELDAALRIAGTIADSRHQGRAMLPAVRRLIELGKWDEAGGLARTFTDPERRASALGAVAEALVEAGETGRAAELARASAEAADSISLPVDRARSMAHAADLLAKGGEADQAADLAHAAAEAARSATDPHWHAGNLRRVAQALADAGRADEAAELAEADAKVSGTITDTSERALGMARAAEVLASAGKKEQAAELARRAVETAAVASGRWRSVALQAAVSVLVGADREGEAAALARTITDPSGKAAASAVVAEALVVKGNGDQAVELACAAAEAARSVTRPEVRANAMVRVVSTFVKAGERNRAMHLAQEAIGVARAVTGAPNKASALAQVSEALVGVGDEEQAVELARAAGEAARTCADPVRRGVAMASAAVALVTAGGVDEAIQLAYTITESDERAQVLVRAAQALRVGGDPDRAAELVLRAESAAQETVNEDWRAMALKSVVGAMVGAGRAEDALRVAHTITAPAQRGAALADVARNCPGTARSRELLAWSLSLVPLSTLAAEVALLAPDVMDDVVGCMRRSLQNA
ncbi:hypothetical protein [Streptomyces sp. NPDC055886]